MAVRTTERSMARTHLFRGDRTVTIRPEDVTLVNIGRIFKLQPATVYLVSEQSEVILPSEDGYIDVFGTQGPRYEVYGEEAGTDSPPAPRHQDQGQNTSRVFAFPARTSALGASAALGCPPPLPPPGPALRSYNRSISIGRIERGELFADGGTLIIHFNEREANLSTITEKVKSDLQTQERVVLCDGHGNRLMEGAGTTGLGFWRQNARKIVALLEDKYEELQKRKRRRSNRITEDNEVLNKMEELVQASMALPAIAETLREMARFAAENHRHAIALTDAQVNSVKATFRCLICQGAMVNPVVGKCCRSMVGCSMCVSEWLETSARCPKCRDDTFGEDNFILSGMEDLLIVLQDIIAE